MMRGGGVGGIIDRSKSNLHCFSFLNTYYYKYTNVDVYYAMPIILTMIIHTVCFFKCKIILDCLSKNNTKYLNKFKNSQRQKMNVF